MVNEEIQRIGMLNQRLDYVTKYRQILTFKTALKVLLMFSVTLRSCISVWFVILYKKIEHLLLTLLCNFKLIQLRLDGKQCAK